MNSFSFVEVWAGAGTMRLALEAHGGRSLLAVGLDRSEKMTYLANFANDYTFSDDIIPFSPEAIPDHDLLVSYLPGAVLRKGWRRSRHHGDPFPSELLAIEDIIDTKKPRAVLIESTNLLLTYREGNPLEMIVGILRDRLGYDIHYHLIPAYHFAPQHRDIIVVAAFREKTPFSWDGIQKPVVPPRLSSVLHRTDGSEPFLPWDGDRFFDHDKQRVQPRYTVRRSLFRDDDPRLLTPCDIADTTHAYHYHDGLSIFLAQDDPLPPRRLTPRECARLMGLPDTFRIPVSDFYAYRQLGCSPVLPATSEAVRIIRKYMTTSNVGHPHHGSLDEYASHALMQQDRAGYAS